MKTFSENTAETSSCDALLIEANQIYQKIETLYKIIQIGLADATMATVQRATDALDSLKEEVRTVDALIAENLRSELYPLESTRILLGRRNDILRKLYTTNDNLIMQAENIKVLIRYEIGNMTKNRHALQGYKPIETHRNTIVKHSF